MLNLQFFSFLVLLFVHTSCAQGTKTSAESINHKQLEFFGDFENTKVSFIFEGTFDTVHFRLANSQELSSTFPWDTIVRNLRASALEFHTSSKLTLNKTLTLEKPTEVELMINGQKEVVFLIPKDTTEIHFALDHDSVIVSFANEDLGAINAYYDSKQNLGGIFMRDFVGQAVFKSTLEEVFSALDSMEILLLSTLKEANRAWKLPEWFLKYEEKNITLSTMLTKGVAPRVRQVLGGIKDSLPEALKRLSNSIDPTDEEALSTLHFVGGLAGLIDDDMDPVQFFELDPVTKFTLMHSFGDRLENERIRDIYNCRLFFDMHRYSTAFPDTLFTSIRNTVSSRMQPYLDRVEKLFKTLEGKPAPNFHLKNMQGDLVTLDEFKRNLVLLDFWFVGCRGCKKEVPHAKKLIAEFRDQPFKLIQVCMNSDPDQWQERQDDLPGVNLFSNPGWDKKLTYSYQLQGAPRYVLIDEAGFILDGWCARPSDPTLTQRIRDHFD